MKTLPILQSLPQAHRDDGNAARREGSALGIIGQSSRAAALCLALGAVSCAPASDAPAMTRKDPVRIVGSSTIFPFAALVAETYSERTGTPVVVEQTGSGGGHKLFCSGDPSIDATTSSRRRKAEEAEQCEANGVSPVIELRLGYDGIVLARGVGEGTLPLDALVLDEAVLYRALARELPRSGTDCTAVANPYARWSEIDPALPDIEIEVYGPPPTSGTRDAFVETAMEEGARRLPCLAEMERRTPNLFRIRAQQIREDGAWIDTGENDNALIRTLSDSPDALGVFGFSFLDQNRDKVRAVPIGGVEPSLETIRSKAYPVVRDLYLYVRSGAEPSTRDALAYAGEFTSGEASGPEGYLEEIGLIPLSGPDRRAVRDALRSVQDTDPS